MKYLILISSLLLLVGCVTTIEISYPVYFNDTGNEVENYKICNELLKNNCDSIQNCIAYEMSNLVCDEDKCYCD